jgi:ligand-binding sensor domain-containing protein
MKHYKLAILISLITAGIFLGSCNKNDDPVDQPFKLPSKVINKITVDSKGVKWFATEKGIVSYDAGKWTTYSDDKNLSAGPMADLAFDLATGIQKLWLASTVGLSSFDFAANSISVQNFSTKNSEILADTVTAIGIDGNNVKYLGTPKGLSILKDGKWDKFFGRKNEEILSKYKISSVGTATNGYVYATTEGGGVSRFKYTDAVSGATTYNLPYANGLPSDTVFTVFVDGNVQWFGTLKGVGYHTSEFTKQDWTSYTRTEGLVCDSVYAIAVDKSGNVWFGTHKGVSFKTQEDKWTTYTTKDGLVADKVNTIAVDPDGSVWFGTDEGIAHFVNGHWEKY